MVLVIHLILSQFVHKSFPVDVTDFVLYNSGVCVIWKWKWGENVFEAPDSPLKYIVHWSRSGPEWYAGIKMVKGEIGQLMWYVLEVPSSTIAKYMFAGTLDLQLPNLPQAFNAYITQFSLTININFNRHCDS